MVTAEMPPALRSTSTFSTPESASSSSLTEDTQWPQVMPETLTVVETVAMACSLSLGREWIPGPVVWWVVQVLAQEASDGIGGLLDFEIDGLRPQLRIRLG